MDVVVLVPRRAGNPERDRLWKFCRRRWETTHPDWRIVEGHHDDGPFNRSAAINTAAAEAGDWDVAVIIDADVITDPTAVRAGVKVAADSGLMTVTHDTRVMLNKMGTNKVLNGFTGQWWQRSLVDTVYHDSVSCSVAVSRELWDTVGGFDPLFVGWGYEDTAFGIACETLTGHPIVRITSVVFHLHHGLAPEAANSNPLRQANEARRKAYEQARGNLKALAPLLAEAAAAREALPARDTKIPRILHRTVPKVTTAEVEAWWDQFARLHPKWELRTYREPLDPDDWPLTGDLWGECQNGAQKAGLIRLEALVTHGGIYVDSDVEPFRSFEPLLDCDAFAGWEDETTIPDFVLGARPGHPAFRQALTRARGIIIDGGGAHESGPAVTTAVLRNRPDVLLLPPGAFAPYHYLEKSQRKNATPETMPWAFCAHHWHHSWGSPTQKASIAKNQR